MARSERASFPQRLAEPGIWRSVGIVALAIALGLGSLAVIWFLATPLALFFVAIVIAQALSPLVDRLERYLPRVAAVIGIFLVLIGIIVGLMLFIVPPLVVQTEQAISHLPQLLHVVGALINRLAPGLGTRLITAISPNITSLLGTVAGPPRTAVTVLLAVVQIAFLSMYWLIAMPGLHRFTLSLFPEGQRSEVASILHEIGETLGGYVRSTIIDAVIVTAVTYIFLVIVGVRYPLVLAAIAFLGEFIPLIGPTIAEVPAIALALLISPFTAIIVFAFYVLLQQFDGNVILPLILRSQANISPLLVTFAVFVGAWVAGLIGALIAIPLAGALKVVVVRILVPLVRSWTGATTS